MSPRRNHVRRAISLAGAHKHQEEACLLFAMNRFLWVGADNGRNAADDVRISFVS
jgi:hypothetical protein